MHKLFLCFALVLSLFCEVQAAENCETDRQKVQRNINSEAYAKASGISEQAASQGIKKSLVNIDTNFMKNCKISAIKTIQDTWKNVGNLSNLLNGLDLGSIVSQAGQKAVDTAVKTACNKADSYVNSLANLNYYESTTSRFSSSSSLSNIVNVQIENVISTLFNNCVLPRMP